MHKKNAHLSITYVKGEIENTPYLKHVIHQRNVVGHEPMHRRAEPNKKKENKRKTKQEQRTKKKREKIKNKERKMKKRKKKIEKKGKGKK